MTRWDISSPNGSHSFASSALSAVFVVLRALLAILDLRKWVATARPFKQIVSDRGIAASASFTDN